MAMRHRVVALAYDQLCTFEFGCTVEVFALPRPELAVPWYEFAVCAARRGPLRAAGGLSVRVPQGLRALERADTIVVPGWHLDEPPAPLLVSKLRAAFARGARLCSICSGVFLLAAAGVLDGRRATTHWRYAPRLAALYPRIRVEPNALYVDEGQVLTSAGSAAGLDMLLHLVRRDHGPKVANQVAQRLVMAPHREGGQAQFVPRPVSLDERGRLSRLLDFVRAHLAESAHAALARGAGRDERAHAAARVCARDRAGAPRVARGRAHRARQGAAGDLAPERAGIAARVGLGSAESLRHHFRRRVGTTPARYRRRFSRR